MAKKAKLFINKKNRQEIKGFEEVIDLLDKENIEYIDHEDQRLENYETYDFLSNEILRLKKLDHLERVQLPIIEDDDQNAVLASHLEQDLNEALDEIILYLLEDGSPFEVEMNRLWKSYFPSSN